MDPRLREDDDGSDAGPTKTQQVRTIPVGAAAWPRCRMHGAQTLPGGAAGPTKVMIERKSPGGSGRLAAMQNARCPNPSRRGRRSYQAGAFLTVIPAKAGIQAVQY